MIPRDDAGRQFSDDVERLLRGEQPLADNADADYKETLLFARKLVDLGQEPNADFTLRLRGRLLTEMATQDAMAPDSRSWFVRLFSRPGLRLAMVSTVVVLAAVGLVWRAGLVPPTASPTSEDAAAGMLSATPAPSAPEAGGPPQMARAANDEGKDATLAVPAPSTTTLMLTGYVAPTATLGEDVSITIEFRNAGPDGYVLTPFPPSIAIREAATGRIVFISAAGTAEHVLSAMESIQYDLIWNQRDSGGAQVEPGHYEADVEAVEARLEKGGMSVPAGASGVTAFDILPETANGTAEGMGTTVE